jgi:voltage-gated potassium channel
VGGIGTFVYFASNLTATIIEGDLRAALKKTRMRKQIAKMKDHIIVCGAGSTGRHIILELVAARVPIVVIDSDTKAIEELVEDLGEKNLRHVIGDATDDGVLDDAALGSARGMVAALPNDKDNLYLVVTTKQTNPSCRIIARVAEVAHMERLKKAGADSVVSPNFIGGMRIVSELVRPSVVRFLDVMLRDKDAAMRIEEVTVAKGSALDGKTLRDADVHGRFGMNVLAVKLDERWTYNPGPEHVLAAPTVVVVMGTTEQVKQLNKAAVP